MGDLEERAGSERAAYEKGLERDRYQKAFGHAHAQYMRKRTRLVNELMADAEGARILELGCNSWVQWVDRAGVTPDEITCINISERELAKGVERATKTRIQPSFRIMDAHHLEFPEKSLDIVFGSSILHHLDIPVALAEVDRVLRPGGKVVFAEPLDLNPVGRIVRRLTPKARTKDEKPFRHAELGALRDRFACEFHFEQFLSVPLGAASGLIYRQNDNPLTRAAFRADEWLLKRWPGTGPYFRRVLIVGHKREQAAA